MTKNVNASDQLERMKGLMSYGLQTESKERKSGIEYSKQGADGKTYAIVREGTSYYIKVADKPNAVLAEEFNYIGGFMNRSRNRFGGFADAQKNFEMKLRSIAEAQGKKGQIVTEAWTPQGQTVFMTETTERMQSEIARQRQIMRNVMNISESKEIEKVASEYTSNEKKNIKSEKHQTGDAKKAEDGFDEKAKLGKTEIVGEGKACPKCGKTPCCCDGDCQEDEVNEEVLAWNANKDYLDTKHGTEIGKKDPFIKPANKSIEGGEGTSDSGEMKNGVVEGAVMHNADNQNTPATGTSEVGKDDPFNKKADVNEAIDDLDDNTIDDEDIPSDDDELNPEDAEFDDVPDDFGNGDLEAEDGISDAEFSDDDTADDIEGLGDEDEEQMEDEDIRSMLHQILDRLDRIEGKDFEDDDLYPEGGEGDADIEGGDEGMEGDDMGADVPEGGDDVPDMGGEDIPQDGAMDDGMQPDEETDECQYFESLDYKRRKQIRENELNVAGKHPAYQKKVMELPPHDMPDGEGQYDMNDDSVKNDQPYGQSIGKGDPFKDNLDNKIENAIQESVRKLMRSKKA